MKSGKPENIDSFYFKQCSTYNLQTLINQRTKISTCEHQASDLLQCLKRQHGDAEGDDNDETSDRQLHGAERCAHLYALQHQHHRTV